MDTKFTPGPWECHEVKTQSGRAFRIGKGAMLEPGPKGCCVIYDDYGHGKNEREANARLIAAAPDMYEALEGILESGESGNIPIEILQPAIDAIAKVGAGHD